VFKPLILEGFEVLQQEIEYQRGVYYVDVYKKMDKKFEELVKKGCPKLLADGSMYQLVINDEIYFDKEFVYFSRRVPKVQRPLQPRIQRIRLHR